MFPSDTAKFSKPIAVGSNTKARRITERETIVARVSLRFIFISSWIIELIEHFVYFYRGYIDSTFPSICDQFINRACPRELHVLREAS